MVSSGGREVNEAMRTLWQHVHLHRRRLLPALSDESRVIQQRIEVAGKQQCWWQSAEIAVQRRQRWLASLFVADIRREQAQRFDHAGAVEHQGIGWRGAHAGRAGQVVDAVIQQRAADPLQQLRQRFEGEQGGRRQMPTGRFTDDDHGQSGKFAIAQDAASGAQTVFQQALDWRRHRQPIIHRQHRHVASVDDGDVEVVVHLRIADHPAATMEIQHYASGFALGTDDAYRHRVDDLAFGAQPMLAQLASAAELTRPQQRLNQPWGEAIADLETRQPGELLLNARTCASSRSPCGHGKSLTGDSSSGSSSSAPPQRTATPGTGTESAR